MPRGRFRRRGVGLVASAGAAGLTSMMTAALAFGDDTAIVSAGSGIPIPPPSYIDAVQLKFLTPNGFGDYPTQPIFMPEGLYPLTGVKSLPLDTSMAQGLTIMNNDIMQHTADGNNVVFFGWSQSATIATLEMDQLAALPGNERPPTDQLSFMLIGDPNNPDGGFLERFVGGSIPTLGVTASGATPDDLYPTTIYTLEYDGYADFPHYPSICCPTSTPSPASPTCTPSTRTCRPPTSRRPFRCTCRSPRSPATT